MIEAETTVSDYRGERMLGRGGMGVVYDAVQTSLQRARSPASRAATA